MVTRSITPVDIHVGRRIRALREARGISQEKLGEAIGLTFQQIQKYEKGANRISVGKLHAIAVILKTPLIAFFPPTDGADAPAVEEFGSGVMRHMRDFTRMDAAAQTKIREICRLIADAQQAAARPITRLFDEAGAP